MNQPVIVNGGGGAGNVFLGLVLFFIVLPICLIGGCGVLTVGCAMIGVGAQHVHESQEKVEAQKAIEQNPGLYVPASDSLSDDPTE